MTEHAETSLRALVDNAAALGIRLNSFSGIGVPDEVLSDYVVRHDIDLVIVGTHGRTGVRRALLGSVTERLIGKLPCDVLAVPTPP